MENIIETRSLSRAARFFIYTHFSCLSHRLLHHIANFRSTTLECLSFPFSHFSSLLVSCHMVKWGKNWNWKPAIKLSFDFNDDDEELCMHYLCDSWLRELRFSLFEFHTLIFTYSNCLVISDQHTIGIWKFITPLILAVISTWTLEELRPEIKKKNPSKWKRKTYDSQPALQCE